MQAETPTPLGEGNGPAVRRTGGNAVAWASAYLLYLGVYSGAVLATFTLGVWDSLLLGFLNSVPEAAAAPLVMRLPGLLGGPRARPARIAVGSLLAAGAFVVWCVVASAVGGALVEAVQEGGWSFLLDPPDVAWQAVLLSPTLVWKALVSLLVFVALAGFGVARSQAQATRRAEARAERLETLRAEARLAVLRAQLNPHFILNVLHSLVGLAERDPALTSEAIERLGTTLRYALRVHSHGADTVALRDELAFTLDYLELERLRLGDRLETRVLIAEPLLDRVVPSFVLQPLVENSIRHAVAPRARGGIVAIAAEEAEGVLSLTVEDDGVAQPVVEERPWRDDSGVGLKLLRDRLHALYGDGASLDFGRSPLGGLRVTVRIDQGDPDAREDVD